MTKIQAALVFSLAGVFVVACGDSGLDTRSLPDGSHGGGLGAGGVLGTGGSAIAGSGGQQSAGGSAGTTPSTGGHAGANAGGSMSGGTSGAGGTICQPVMCPMIACLNGSRPSPDPCGCPICNAYDAGADSSVDAECQHLPCPLIKCQSGYQLSAPACGCPTCVPADAGAPDTTVCAPRACPAIACVEGTVPNPDPCGCPICATHDAGVSDTAVCSVLCPNLVCSSGIVPSPEPCGCPTCAPTTDGGPDGSKLACVGLDECACHAATGCAPIADACYCPYPQCSSAGACVCGGGKFIGCAPSGLTTCTDAKARVASLCPQIGGSIWDAVCNQSDSGCIAACLNQVSACSDIACAMCEACDCASDSFTRCVATCKSALTSATN